MKTCQSCKWCDFNEKSPDISQCKAPKSYTISVITGKPEYQEHKYCTTHRSKNRIYLCGVKGRWWEAKYSEDVLEKPKSPWYTRLLQYLIYGRLK